jgi:hypothetical protein
MDIALLFWCRLSSRTTLFPNAANGTQTCVYNPHSRYSRRNIYIYSYIGFIRNYIYAMNKRRDTCTAVESWTQAPGPNKTTIAVRGGIEFPERFRVFLTDVPLSVRVRTAKHYSFLRPYGFDLAVIENAVRCQGPALRARTSNTISCVCVCGQNVFRINRLWTRTVSTGTRRWYVVTKSSNE